MRTLLAVASGVLSTVPLVAAQEVHEKAISSSAPQEDVRIDESSKGLREVLDAIDAEDVARLGEALPRLEAGVEEAADAERRFCSAAGAMLAYALVDPAKTPAAKQRADKYIEEAGTSDALVLEFRARFIAPQLNAWSVAGGAAKAEAMAMVELGRSLSDRARYSMLDALAQAIRNQDDPARAEAVYREALDLARTAFPASHPKISSALSGLATCLTQLQRPDDALPLAEESFQLAEQWYGPDHAEVAVSLNNLLNCLDGPQHAARRIASRRRVMEILERELLPGHDHRAIARENLAQELREQGFLNEAIAIIDVSIDECRAAGVVARRSLVFALRERARIAGALGDARTLYETLSEAVRVRDSSLGGHAPFETATLLAQLGEAAIEVGDHEVALDATARAVALAESSGVQGNPLLAMIYGARGFAVGELGDYEGACVWHSRALEVRRGFPQDRGLIAQSLRSMGVMHSFRGDLEEARSYLEEALAIDEEVLGSGHRFVGIGLMHLTGIYARIGDYNRAIEAGTRSVDILSAWNEATSHMCESRVELANALAAVGRSEESLEVLRAASQAYLKLPIRPNPGHFHSAAVALSSEDRASARRHLLRFVDEIEHMRSWTRVSGSARRSLFVRLRRMRPFERLAQLALQDDDPLEALRFLERGRAWNWSETIAGMYENDAADLLELARTSGDDDLVTEAEKLVEQEKELATAREAATLSLRRTRIEALDQDPEVGQDAIRKAAAAIHALDEHASELLARERELFSSISIGRAGRDVAPLLERLAPGEGALSFAVVAEGATPARTIALLATRDGVVGYSGGELRSSDVEAIVTQMAASGRRGLGEGNRREVTEDVNPELRRLSEALLPDALRADLIEIERLLVIRPSELGALPLELLHWSGGETGRWLGSGPPVSYVPALAPVLDARSRTRARPRSEKLLVLGNPRPRGDSVRVLPSGCQVLSIASGSAAVEAGLEVGDVILSVAGRTVESRARARLAIRRIEDPEGALEVWRDGALVSVDAPSTLAGVRMVASERSNDSRVMAELADYEQRAAILRSLPALDGAQQEAAAVAKRAESAGLEVQLHLGPQASEPALHALGESATWIHLACHAVADRSAGGPLIVLSTPELLTADDDGVVTLSELLSSRWRRHLANCEMVVLSACSTGVGEARVGEGSDSLAVGLANAGVRSAILTSWDVDDTWTTKLMDRLYANVLDLGMAPLTALEQARLEMLRQGAPASVWGAPIHTGDPR